MALSVGETLCEPLVALLPLHPPVAVQEVALVEDHDIVEEFPTVIEVGAGEIDTDGVGGVTAGVTATVADCRTETPDLSHRRV